MTRKMNLGFLIATISVLLIAMTAGSMVAAGQTQRALNAHATVIQQPLYGDYKGVRVGMAAEEVRAKLGKPAMQTDEQDYWIVSQSETVQIAYDAAHNARAISIDFIDGIGAPDYKAVVGADIETSADGSMHKLVNYNSLGFWVSYHRSVGNVPTVTITIQKIL